MDDNEPREHNTTLVSISTLCKGMFSDFKFCIVDTGNNIYHPKCLGIKKLLEILECDKN